MAGKVGIEGAVAEIRQPELIKLANESPPLGLSDVTSLGLPRPLDAIALADCVFAELSLPMHEVNAFESPRSEDGKQRLVEGALRN
jgi:hypothetical protein